MTIRDGDTFTVNLSSVQWAILHRVQHWKVSFILWDGTYTWTCMYMFIDTHTNAVNCYNTSVMRFGLLQFLFIFIGRTADQFLKPVWLAWQMRTLVSQGMMTDRSPSSSLAGRVSFSEWSDTDSCSAEESSAAERANERGTGRDEENDRLPASFTCSQSKGLLVAMSNLIELTSFWTPPTDVTWTRSILFDKEPSALENETITSPSWSIENGSLQLKWVQSSISTCII